jgi:hypothetical protein
MTRIRLAHGIMLGVVIGVALGVEQRKSYKIEYLDTHLTPMG